MWLVHCEVCAVSLAEVEIIVSNHLNEKTKIISLQPNTLEEVFDDIKKVANQFIELIDEVDM